MVEDETLDSLFDLMICVSGGVLIIGHLFSLLPFLYSGFIGKALGAIFGLYTFLNS
jgi:hypothetical protein